MEEDQQNDMEYPWPDKNAKPGVELTQKDIENVTWVLLSTDLQYHPN